MRWLPTFLFGGLLLLGAFIFDDYGVHWDEYRNQRFGQRMVRRIARLIHVDEAASGGKLREHDYTHGPLFELFLQGAERLSGFRDFRRVILLRHYLTFLTYCLGVLGVWRLFIHLLGGRHWALLGSVIFIAHPRIFAHAFYNSVDIPFLAVFVWSIYTLLLLLDKPGPGRALMHSVLSGLLIAVRLFGGIVPVITAFAVLIDLITWRRDRARARALLFALILYGPACLAVAVLFWPLLWSDA